MKALNRVIEEVAYEQLEKAIDGFNRLQQEIIQTSELALKTSAAAIFAKSTTFL